MTSLYPDTMLYIIYTVLYIIYIVLYIVFTGLYIMCNTVSAGYKLVIYPVNHKQTSVYNVQHGIRVQTSLYIMYNMGYRVYDQSPVPC